MYICISIFHSYLDDHSIKSTDSKGRFARSEKADVWKGNDVRWCRRVSCDIFDHSRDAAFAAEAKGKHGATSTPEAQRRASIGRTPKNSFNPRMSLGNGTSPLLERVLHLSAESTPVLARNSFGKANRGGESCKPASRKSDVIGRAGAHIGRELKRNSFSVPDAVLERAAEAIVYDLVNVESPAAKQGVFFDPNSSFGKLSIKLHLFILSII